MDRLDLDYETAGTVDLKEVGLWNYATHEQTRVLMLNYSFDKGPVQIWKPYEGPMPDELVDALTDPFVIKYAFNCAFERLITKFVVGIDVPISEWRDIQVMARYYSLPGSLEDVSEILGLGMDTAKIHDGKRLIKKFCVPFIEGGEQTLFGESEAAFKDHRTDPDDWKLFENYGGQDVRAEIAVDDRLADYQLPSQEWRYWELDQEINSRGIPIDLELVDSALIIVKREQERLYNELKALTGVENPNSDDQIKEFLKTRGYPFTKLGKSFVARALAGEGNLTEEAKTVLELRSQLSKSGVDKFSVFRAMTSPDSHLRGQFSFMGASRTGRYASHGINVQNLPRPVKEVNERLDEAIALVKANDYEGIQNKFKSSVLDVLSSCIRPVFRAPEGSRFIISDLNAIENRVLGWIARCPAMMQVFEKGLCPYKSFAVELYKKPYESISKEERNNSKPAVLGAGFRLSGGEEIINSEGEKIYTGLLAYSRSMNIEMSKELADKAVAIFRKKYKEVKSFWYDLEDAYIRAVRDGEEVELGYLRFKTKNNVLQMTLPSGRSLHYLNPRIAENTVVQGRDGEYTKTALYYDGQDQVTRQWVQVETHGGKLAENGAQSIARDILMVGIWRAKQINFDVRLHAHDEIGAIVPYSSPLSVKDLEKCMADSIEWGTGLILGAEGFESEIYRKN
jgi:DNA polymerase